MGKLAGYQSVLGSLQYLFQFHKTSRNYSPNTCFIVKCAIFLHSFYM